MKNLSLYCFSLLLLCLAASIANAQVQSAPLGPAGGSSSGGGGGGGGAVSSVSSNGDGTVTVFPNIGDVLINCATATTLQIGCTKPDGSTIVVDANGVLTVIAAVQTIVNGTTPTSGFTDTDFLVTSGGFVADSGIPLADIGTVQQVNVGCADFTAPGPGVTTTGTIATQFITDKQTGTTYSIPTSDCGGVVYGTITASSTYTLPALATGGYVWAVNAQSSTANLIISCGSSCIMNDGTMTTNILGPGQSALYVNTGGDPTVQWQVINARTGAGSTIITDTGTSRTFAQTDCGTSIRFTSNSSITATISTVAALPIGCSINIIQRGTAKVTVSGSGITVANDQSFTGTSGTAGSFINLLLDTATTAVLSGHGS